MSSTTSSSSSSSWSRTLLLLLLLPVPPCLLHPQPCHLLAQIGHTVRVGALLPAQRPVRLQVQAALNRAAAAVSRDRNQNLDSDLDPDLELDMDTDLEREREQRRDNFLPYNLSLELVARQPAAADPESLLRCVCQGVVVQAVSAVLAFPQSREELLQVDLMASFLQIPFLSIVEHGEPLRTQVGRTPHLDPGRTWAPAPSRTPVLSSPGLCLSGGVVLLV